MKDRLPRAAKIYITFVMFLAIACVLQVMNNNPIEKVNSAWVLSIIMLGIFAGRKTVSIASNRSLNANASVNLGFIATLVALFYSGPGIGMIVAASTIPVSNYKFRNIYQFFFNIAAVVVGVWFVSYIFGFGDEFGINSSVFIRGNQSGIIHVALTIVSILFCVLIYHLVTALLVTWAVSLSMGWNKSKTFEFFRANTLWIAPVYLVAGCFVVLIIWVLHNVKTDFEHVIPICIVLFPLPILFFHNLKLHRERDMEREMRFKELEDLYSSMVQAMGRAIEAKDKYTQEHISRVVAISMGIGRKVGLSVTELRSLEVGAALHDIGKIAIPEDILNKPGKLTPEEFLLVQEHAALGSQILQPVPFPPQVVEAVRHHHEKWDGTGYPDKLAGESIPLVARIVAVADVYDALTSDRPYRAAWSHERAMSFLREQVGKHFDQSVFTAFEAAMIAQPELCTTAIDLPLPDEPRAVPPAEDAPPLRKAA